MTQRIKMVLTPHALVSQLGYHVSSSLEVQAQKIIENTKGFDKFSKHIITLHEDLLPLKGFISFSNSVDRLKIKCDIIALNSESVEEFHKIVQNWSAKYKVEIQKVNSSTYYIVGH